MSISQNSKNLSLDTQRHSMAHLMAAAVKQMFPEAQFGVGPVIENGCYYDFILPRTLIPEDLPLIEKHMRDMLKRNIVIKKQEMGITEAIMFFDTLRQPLKVELLMDIRDKGTTKLNEEERDVFEAAGEGEELKVTIYRLEDEDTGEDLFVDLCKGPHVGSLKDLRKLGFSLDKFSASYWRGDQERDIRMQRVYALVLESQEEHDEHIKLLEEAKKRDHRILNKDLQLFALDEQVGAGLPLWLPNGQKMVDLVENLAKQKEKEYGYLRVGTPHIAKEDLYLTSGHLPYYEEDMFPAMELDNEKYYLKAMNCPHHHKIFAASPKSYRDLPLRFAEYGHCYRFEDSGSLFGLMRVRSLKMNDAHIYCTEEQFKAEFAAVIKLYLEYFEIFGIKKYVMRLSKHSKEKLGKKYVNEPELWIKTENLVRQTLQDLNVNFVEAEDEAAFYGPKIDVQIWSVIGREFTLATNQLDFAVPKRFNLTYTDVDGSEQTPICIHRAPLSTHERFIGFLVEHYGGRFPFWLAPNQVKVLTVNNEEATLNYVTKIKEVLNDIVTMKPLKYNELRYQIDDRNESLGRKIREAEVEKVPVILIVGPRDIEAQVVSVRTQEGEQKIQLSDLKSFLENLQ